jgi:hypothetical protein
MLHAGRLPWRQHRERLPAPSRRSNLHLALLVQPLAMPTCHEGCAHRICCPRPLSSLQKSRRANYPDCRSIVVPRAAQAMGEAEATPRSAPSKRCSDEHQWCFCTYNKGAHVAVLLAPCGPYSPFRHRFEGAYLLFPQTNITVPIPVF